MTSRTPQQNEHDPVASLALDVHVAYRDAPDGTEMWALASVRAAHGPDAVFAETQVELVVALDVSGSMQGGKIKMCKQNLVYLIEHVLKPVDRLGLVAFGSVATRVFAPTLMDAEGKSFAIQKIMDIKCDGGTNLSGGILTALNLLEGQDCEFSAVAVLTDGQWNEGLTDVLLLEHEIRRIQKEATTVQVAHCGIYTFGYGIHCDARVLGDIAKISHGTFYAVEDRADQVGVAFNDMLGGLFSIVAREIKLTCTIAQSLFEKELNLITKTDPEPLLSFLPNQPHEGMYPEREGRGRVRLDLRELCSGETRDVLIGLRFSPEELAVAMFPWCAELKLEYVDLLRGGERRRVLLRLYADPANGLPHPQDLLVARQLMRIQVLKATQRSMDLANEASFESARAVIREAQRAIADLRERYPGTTDPVLAELELDAATMESIVSKREIYQTRRNEMGGIANRQLFQRGFRADESEPPSVYQTTRRAAFRTAFRDRRRATEGRQEVTSASPRGGKRAKI